MAEVEPGGKVGSRRGRGPGRGRGQGQRRPPTWEISDSDFESDATAEAGAGPQSAVGERRAAAEARRPEQALQCLVVRVDPGVATWVRVRGHFCWAQPMPGVSFLHPGWGSPAKPGGAVLWAVTPGKGNTRPGRGVSLGVGLHGTPSVLGGGGL